MSSSTDGVTWITQISSFGTTGITAVAYGNSLWIAAGAAGQIRSSDITKITVPRRHTYPYTGYNAYVKLGNIK